MHKHDSQLFGFGRSRNSVLINHNRLNFSRPTPR